MAVQLFLSIKDEVSRKNGYTAIHSVMLCMMPKHCRSDVRRVVKLDRSVSAAASAAPVTRKANNSKKSKRPQRPRYASEGHNDGSDHLLYSCEIPNSRFKLVVSAAESEASVFERPKVVIG